MSINVKRNFVFILTILLLGVVLVFASNTFSNEPDVNTPAVSKAPNGEEQVPMTDIHDIKPLVAVGQGLPWKIILIVLLAIILLLAVFFCWRRFRKAVEIADVIPLLPPEVNAHRALDQIGALDQMDGKTFYFSLSAILRRYLQERFGMHAPEMTTEELLPELETLHLDSKLYDGLVQLYCGADPIKYAGERPQIRQMELDLAFARNFINGTTPKEDGMPEDNKISTSTK